jgi:hypothetical protein
MLTPYLALRSHDRRAFLFLPCGCANRAGREGTTSRPPAKRDQKTEKTFGSGRKKGLTNSKNNGIIIMVEGR